MNDTFDDPAARQRIVADFRAEVETVRASLIEAVEAYRRGVLTGRPRPDVVIAFAFIETAGWLCADLVGRDHQCAVSLVHRLAAFVDELNARPKAGGPVQ